MRLVVRVSICWCLLGTACDDRGPLRFRNDGTAGSAGPAMSGRAGAAGSAEGGSGGAPGNPDPCGADLLNSPGNCGACGYDCKAGRACVDGRCTPAWMPVTSVGAPSPRIRHGVASFVGRVLLSGGTNVDNTGAMNDVFF